VRQEVSNRLPLGALGLEVGRPPANRAAADSCDRMDKRSGDGENCGLETWSTASISTGISNGSSAIPTADRAPRPGVAEHLNQQVGAAVDDCWSPVEPRQAVDHPKDLDQFAAARSKDGQREASLRCAGVYLSAVSPGVFGVHRNQDSSFPLRARPIGRIHYFVHAAVPTALLCCCALTLAIRVQE
jgi:hypothetical protein